jgi:hypothetical protein
LAGKTQARDAYELLDELWSETVANLWPSGETIG